MMSNYENPNEADSFEVTRRLQQFGSVVLLLPALNLHHLRRQDGAALAAYKLAYGFPLRI